MEVFVVLLHDWLAEENEVLTVAFSREEAENARKRYMEQGNTDRTWVVACKPGELRR